VDVVMVTAEIGFGFAQLYASTVFAVVPALRKH
jgi:hypothetical protein